MKTAISVPDDTFGEVTKRARQLGMSRSEFFSKAARRYLEELDRTSLTEALDAALEHVDDDSSRAAVTAGRRRLAVAEDW